MGANLGHILVAYLGTIRPNYRPNIRPNAAEYSVSADTSFICIGRTLFFSYLRLDMVEI